MSDLRALLGELTFPLIQAPMAGVQNEQLAIAVCKAGGLGSLPCAMLTTEQITAAVSHIRSETSAPFNLNFFCHKPPSSQGLSRWHDRLAPYFVEYGIDASTIPTESARQPFSEQHAELLEQIKPTVVSFHFGLPDAPLLNRVKATGAFVLSTATSAEEASWLEEQGADGIILQGIEAGGHQGHFLSEAPTGLTIKELLAEVAPKTSLPCITAGGIASNQEIKELLSAGASAVQLGTSFLLCDEALTSNLHRQALETETPTQLTNVFTGRLARGMVNRCIEELGPVSTETPEFPLAANAMGKLRQASEARGLADFTPLWSGTNQKGCESIPAAELIQKFFETQ